MWQLTNNPSAKITIKNISARGARVKMIFARVQQG
jgi:hypothetical protein